MDLLKALKRTTILTATAALALGATEAYATDGVAYLAHMSASVASTLNVTELSAMRFGNFMSGTGTGTVQLGANGTITGSGSDTILYGLSNGGGSSGFDETSSQAPGFFSIVTDGPTKVFVTFADSSGNIIDTQHPANHVIMSSASLTVDSFTFMENGASAGVSGTGYAGTASAADTEASNYGQFITVAAGGDEISVGATLHDAGGTPAGRYTGEYYIMVSY